MVVQFDAAGASRLTTCIDPDFVYMKKSLGRQYRQWQNYNRIYLICNPLPQKSKPTRAADSH